MHLSDSSLGRLSVRVLECLLLLLLLLVSIVLSVVLGLDLDSQVLINITSCLVDYLGDALRNDVGFRMWSMSSGAGRRGGSGGRDGS